MSDVHAVILAGGGGSLRPLLRQHLYKQLGVKHRIGNLGVGPLHIVEFQIGKRLGEDDIQRYASNYGKQLRKKGILK